MAKCEVRTDALLIPIGVGSLSFLVCSATTSRLALGEAGQAWPQNNESHPA